MPVAKKIIKRKVAMALLRADDAQGRPTVHSIKYRKKDRTVGYKNRVTKSYRHLPGEGKFRGNINTNHELLLINLDEPDPKEQHFRIKVDYLISFDGMVIDHLNGEHPNGNPNL
jgi:hypothetical protein